MLPNLRDWYWIVGGNGPHADDNGKLTGDESRVFSSKRNAYVSSDDEEYQAWQSDVAPAGLSATRIDTEANLADVLKPWGIEAKF